MYYIDLNVFWYWLRRGEHSAACTKLMRLIESGKVRAATGTHVLSEFYYALKGRGLKTADIVELVVALLSIQNLVWLQIDEWGYVEALKTQAEKGLDHMDALHFETMRENQIETMITYDKHFDGVVAVMTPEELLVRKD